MKGQHAPGGGARREREQGRGRDRAAEPDVGRRRAKRAALRILLLLVGLTAVVLIFVLVRGFIGFDHAVRHPEDGFSDWQCASQSGTCGP